MVHICLLFGVSVESNLRAVTATSRSQAVIMVGTSGHQIHHHHHHHHHDNHHIIIILVIILTIIIIFNGGVAVP